MLDVAVDGFLPIKQRVFDPSGRHVDYMAFALYTLAAVIVAFIAFIVWQLGSVMRGAPKRHAKIAEILSPLCKKLEQKSPMSADEVAAPASAAVTTDVVLNVEAFQPTRFGSQKITWMQLRRAERNSPTG